MRRRRSLGNAFAPVILLDRSPIQRAISVASASSRRVITCDATLHAGANRPPGDKPLAREWRMLKTVTNSVHPREVALHGARQCFLLRVSFHRDPAHPVWRDSLVAHFNVADDLPGTTPIASALRAGISKRSLEKIVITPDAQSRLIQFLLSRNDRAQFIARHVQLRGYGDPGDRRLEVGLRERVAYIVMTGTEVNAPAKRWSIELDAQKQQLEAEEAALLAKAFDALSLPEWRTMIDACARGPEAAFSLGLQWQRRQNTITIIPASAVARR